MTTLHAGKRYRSTAATFLISLPTADDGPMNHFRATITVRHFIRRSLTASGIVFAILLCLSANNALAQKSPQNEPDINQLMQGKIFIYKLDSGDKAGKGYKLVYMVAAPLSAYWKFKTDFKNDFLRTNELISEHRIMALENNVVVTENMYATRPGVRFRWRTVSLPDIHRLDFELLNPNECGQKFHYGHIQLEPVGEHTKVTQVAYFDFFGVTLWMNYPWYGGMQHYLNYTARWEQETVVRLIDRYR